MKTFFVWFKRAAALVVLALAAVAFSGAGPKWLSRVAIGLLVIQPAFSLGFLTVLALSPVFGRLFCECLCPLGTLQSIISRIARPRRSVRRVCTRLPVSRVQLAVRWTVFAIFAILLALGYGALAYMITPYSIIGKSFALFVPGLAVFAVAALGAFFADGRIWCNWVCPAGTLFSVFAGKSLLRNTIGKGCENCRKCFPSGPGKTDAGERRACGAEVTRRTALKGAVVLAASRTVEKSTDGGVAAVSLPGVPERPATVLPPGAVSRDDFNLKCVGCGLCVTRCPMNVLRQSTGLKTFGQPEMYFQNGYCRLSCAYKCAAACPTGALIPRTENRANLHMGHAIWRKDICLRTAEGDGKENCSACVRNCPVKALHFVDGAVAVDKAVCIGCGACEHVCPARPEPAVIVKGFDRQREVRPMEKGDLIAEMVAAVDSGWSCVIAKGGIIVARDKGRGIKPLLGFLDRGKLEGAIVADKIIGRAAAAICIVGGVKEVYAKVMSEGAEELLEKFNVKVSSGEAVKEIINREKNGICPMEAKVSGSDDPYEMVKRISPGFGRDRPDRDE